MSDVYSVRLADWRCRQVVYQVMVDRFATTPASAPRREYYPAPARLRAWNEKPTRGHFLSDERVWSHEIDFWGGTLAGLTARLDHLVSLGVNVLYLTPIFRAFTNHKYDTIDYLTIDPQFGNRVDFEKLCAQAHRQGIRVILDGVFNHVGERCQWFQTAKADPSSPYRRYFEFDAKLKHGYLCWNGAPSLPELDIGETPVREVLWGGKSAVVPAWLEHADGWRLDVAFDLGPEALAELTAAAHRARVDSLVVGEIYNEPSRWLATMDGVLNMYLGRLVIELSAGRLPPRQMGWLMHQLVEDSGLEGLLRSWIVLSNHDRPRLKTQLPELARRQFALALQATLPGAPQFYYGEEIGLEGGEDPEQRGPMDWDAVRDGQAPELALTRRVIALRNTCRALQVGDYRPIAAEHLYAFTRHTASVRDTVLVVANPGTSPISEIISPRDSWLMDGTPLDDALGGKPALVQTGLVHVTVPPHTVQVLVPRIGAQPGYDRYKRVP